MFRIKTRGIRIKVVRYRYLFCEVFKHEISEFFPFLDHFGLTESGGPNWIRFQFGCSSPHPKHCISITITIFLTFAPHVANGFLFCIRWRIQSGRPYVTLCVPAHDVCRRPDPPRSLPHGSFAQSLQHSAEPRLDSWLFCQVVQLRFPRACSVTSYVSYIEDINFRYINPLNPVLWIRSRSDPKLFAGPGSGVGSGKNHSGSGQPLSGMNLKQNFSDKIYNFSTRLCIRFPIRYCTDRIYYLFQKPTLH